MIVAWMAYALFVSGLLALSALAVERIALLFRAPARWAWTASLTASVLLPIVSRLRPPTLLTPRAVGAQEISATTSGPSETMAIGSQLADLFRDFSVVETLQAPLLVAWMTSSALLLLVLALVAREWRRQRRRSTPARIGDTNVRLSDGFGPAVVGILDRWIVLPRWVLDYDETDQDLIVRHEREHLRRADNVVLAGATTLLALTPWNIAMWWQLRRLRMAIEMDCDRRVLAGGGALRRYSQLLLDVKCRSMTSRLLVPALSDSPTLLERRLEVMTEKTPSTRWVRAGFAAAVASLFVALACETPAPQEPLSANALAKETGAIASGTLHKTEPRIYVYDPNDEGSSGAPTVEWGGLTFRLRTGANGDLKSFVADRLESIDIVKGSRAEAEFGAEHGVILLRLRERSKAITIEEEFVGQAAREPATYNAVVNKLLQSAHETRQATLRSDPAARERATDEAFAGQLLRSAQEPGAGTH